MVLEIFGKGEMKYLRASSIIKKLFVTEPCLVNLLYSIMAFINHTFMILWQQFVTGFTYPLYIALGSIYVCLFETYLLRNGWTDLKNSFFVSSVLIRERFQAENFWNFRKKISLIFLQSISKILQNVNTTLGRSPETPDSGKAARGQRRSGQ